MVLSLKLILPVLIFTQPTSDTLVTITTPWESEDISLSEAYLPLPPTQSGLGQFVGEKLIYWYQNRLSRRSIHRCPYLISCSNYTLRAIQENGLGMGILQFIDRNLYRENPGIWQYYPLVETSDRGLKLDDTFYLTGKTPAPLFLGGNLQIQGEGYAEELLRQGDYYRAITEFKRRMFLNPADSTYCLLQIARAYRHSGKFQSAISYASATLERQRLTLQQNHDANLTLGLSYIGLQLSVMAQQYFEAAHSTNISQTATLCLGWLYAQRENWREAERYFNSATESIDDISVSETALQLSLLARQGSMLPRRSPTLAAAFSGILPGLGQFYSGHSYDGLQAFLLVSSFALATYATYKYESEPGRRIKFTYVGIGVTSLFHLANIFSAHRTANYFNWRQRDDNLRKMRNLILPYAY